MTGFGRCGTTWGHEQCPIVPDVIYGGKGLGGGYVPMGMLATTARVAEPLAGIGGFMFFTFTGNDPACAGASKVLEILDPRVVASSAAPRWVRCWRPDWTTCWATIRTCARSAAAALFQGVELVRDRDTDAPFPAAAKFTSAVVTECLARDMWVYPAGSGPVQDGVMIGCPFIITEAEIEQIVVTLRDGIDAAAQAV